MRKDDEAKQNEENERDEGEQKKKKMKRNQSREARRIEGDGSARIKDKEEVRRSMRRCRGSAVGVRGTDETVEEEEEAKEK